MALAKWIKRFGEQTVEPMRTGRTLYDFRALAEDEIEAGKRRARIRVPQRPLRPAPNPLDWGKY